ncbi:MAG TPA: tRNA (N(6)-L-threonylcarbamoyladenosine(37)-C(2))-methylthiotransferase MtaB [Rhizomicrobium sp.]|jgi:threonylcarbamoyladenosine tRNA methylthiotransferase MtaB|nr:tRNA (N(6)-L-threonylcarbamoyladenosine(37)-C(2))-methylthiotransferase MtaB [Rhizomicrobium sp.]
MSEPEVITFGCRVNAYESEVIRARAREAGLGNAVIFNTCAVTGEAVRQSRQAIRSRRRANPDAKIIVTGCAAQIDPRAYAEMPEVDLVLGNEEKLDGTNYRDFGIAAAERVRVNDILSIKETAAQFVDSFEGRTRAFLQVQNGCDHRCTFCIIPYGRGNSRSVPMGSIFEEARRLVTAGYAEIVLTGVDLTAYGRDLPGSPSLGALVRKLLKMIPDLRRLRLSSLDSVEADCELLRVIAEEERLMPHFHLSVQAGDDLILKRMKRRHGRRDTIAFCETVRRVRPEAAFGADLIAGFPTETEAMFANTLALVDEAELTFLHVFPFSPRTGTPAARMPQVARPAVRERAARLRAKGSERLRDRLNRLVGSRQSVLVEGDRRGRTACYASVTLDRPVPPGQILQAAIAGATADRLEATVIS